MSMTFRCVGLMGLLLVLPLSAGAQPKTNFYEITTPMGRMVVRLYDETPLHRDNFRRLVREAYYDSTTFHRVIDGFMIQGGDANTKDADPLNDGMGDPGYTIPAEFNPALYHKRGALAAARQGDDLNPERRSSGSQFYLVQGRATLDSLLLDQMEQRVRLTLRDTTFRYAPEARATYARTSGTPFLDMQYTVFGELVEGMDVLHRIARTPTPRNTGQPPAHPALYDRPLDRIWMVIRPLPPDYQPASDG
jgi:peptidyl-prolyl cis-trans isomerase B (cyclophilin B)